MARTPKISTHRTPARTGASRDHRRDSRWTAEVTEYSDALALEAGVFTLNDPREIARSLMRSAEASKRRKASPYRSAMSMLTFYINRAGRGLPEERRRVLERAKDELRKHFRSR